MPSHVPLLGVSATLTKSMRLRILVKAGFRGDYKLMHTSFDSTGNPTNPLVHAEY